MKKLALLLLLGTITVFISCNRDNGPKIGLDLDGTFYDDFEGYYDDYGTYYYGPFLRNDGSTSDTHRRFMVMLTDGVFDNQSCWPDDQTFSLNISFYSPSLDEDLKNGEYEFYVSWPQEDLTGQPMGRLYGYFDETPDYYYEAAEGTITVTGTFPSITAKVDLFVYYYEIP